MRNTWLSPRAVGLHVTLAVVLPLFAWAAWWQLHRALGGNTLSWAYTFEWPFFGIYAVLTWWRLVHDVAADRRLAAASGGPGNEASGPSPEALAPDADAPDRTRKDASAHAALAAGADGTGGRTEEDRELEAYNAYLSSLADEDARRRR